MRYKNFWILLIMLLAGIVLGGFMGQLAEGISWLSWLNYGQSFGLDSPLVIDFASWSSPSACPSDHHGQHHRPGCGADHLPADLIPGGICLPDRADAALAVAGSVLGEVRKQEDLWQKYE